MLAKNRYVKEDAPCKKWVRSRFNMLSTAQDGHLLLYNSFTGNIGAIPPDQKAEALAALGRNGVTGDLTGVVADMQEGGFLVPEGTDECRRAQFMLTKLRANGHLHLIIMPTEDCNFRCLYCYESFARGKMSSDIRQGIKTFVSNQTSHINQLLVSWFGGEPLIALDVIEELSKSFIEVTEACSVPFKAVMTTNGYNLTPENLSRLLDWHVRAIQVTIDGLGEDHDRLRTLKEGGPTFEVIWDNLRAAKQLDKQFNIAIRVNLAPGSVSRIDPFLTRLQEELAGDPRFSVFFRTAGHWGGPNDHLIEVCDSVTADKLPLQTGAKALQMNLPIGDIEFNFMRPSGSVCYAAHPNSFVIGANGSIYKCTVALDNHINHVGQLNPDGTMDLDMDKFALWVTSDGEHDPACVGCFFRPSCHGAACPMHRIDSGKPPCPMHKRNIKSLLELAYEQSIKFPELGHDGSFSAPD